MLTAHRYLCSRNRKNLKNMKLKNLLLAMAAMLCLAACNDDDDATPGAADRISGTYEGTISLTVMGQDQGSSALEAVVEAESATAVSITLLGDAESTSAMSIKKIPLTGIVVTTDGTNYTLTKNIPEDGYTVTDTESQVNWKITSFAGSVEGGEATLEMVAQPGAMPMGITMKFTGSKQ